MVPLNVKYICYQRNHFLITFSDKNSQEDLLKVKQNEILFVRKGNDRSTEPRRCCLRSSRQLSVVVDHKHLRRLLLVEGQVIDPNKTSIQAARYANNKDSNENSCGRVLNVFHVKRMKGCQWRVAQINCTFSSNVARDRWEHVFQNLISCKWHLFSYSLILQFVYSLISSRLFS